MTTRTEIGQTYTQTWDAENKLAEVTWTQSTIYYTTTFHYDGDGNRLQKIEQRDDGTTNAQTVTLYIGEIFEVAPTLTPSTTKYYYFGQQRVAVRNGTELYYLHGDHLGSTSLTTCGENCPGKTTGQIVSERRYHPFGLERYTDGTHQTDFGYTGQRDEAGFGLYDYQARYYDPLVGRFISPDTIVPDPINSQDWNRYTYVRSNPIRSTDPNGHECTQCLPSPSVVEAIKAAAQAMAAAAAAAGFGSEAAVAAGLFVGGATLIAGTTLAVQIAIDEPIPAYDNPWGGGFSLEGERTGWVEGIDLEPNELLMTTVPINNTVGIDTLPFPLGVPDLEANPNATEVPATIGLDIPPYLAANSREFEEVYYNGSPSVREQTTRVGNPGLLEDLYNEHPTVRTWRKVEQLFDYGDYEYDLHWFEGVDAQGDLIIERGDVKGKWWRNE